MDKKAISEIRKLIKPDAMEKESLEKYCEILRSAMSGKLGRNLFNMEFPISEEMEGGRQALLYQLLRSELRDDDLLTRFFEKWASFEC